MATVYTDSAGMWDFGELSVIPTIYAYTEFGIRQVLRGEIVGTIGGSVDMVTSGAFRIVATAVLTGDGFYTDYNAGTPRLRIGTVSGGALVKGVYWDGANLAWIGVNTSLTAAGLFTAANAVITGTITASAGLIGGWTINATYLAKDTGVAATSAGMAPLDWCFYAGATYANRENAPFRVTAAGALVATSATITGAITATSGTIGSFTIGTYLYTGSKTAWNDANAGVHLGSDGIGIGNNVFTVSSAGALVATSATITGTITASAGAIGGWTIGATYLAKDTGVAATSSGMAPNDWSFYAGATYANRETAPFRVTLAGALTATSATITGTLTMTGGSASLGSGNSILKFNTTDGLWLGNAVFASAPFRVSLAGALTATSGSIGNWTINVEYLAYDTGVNATSSGMAPLDISFYAGATYANRLTAPFRVSLAGALTATSATITGAITATSGTIGSFTIGTYLYTGSKTAWNDANAGVHLGSDGIGIGNNVFTVNGSTGALVATSATITGTITASAGTIGGWTIGATGMSSGAGATFVAMNTDGVSPAFWAGSENGPLAPFRVTNAGVLVVTNATITGAITATSGSLSGVLTIGASGGIFQGTGSFAVPTTALKIYNSGGVGLLEMWSGGVKQVSLDSGGLWLANNTQILFRNAANTANIQVIGFDATDIIYFGASKLVVVNPATGATTTGALAVTAGLSLSADITFTQAIAHRIQGVAGQQLHIASDGTTGSLLLLHNTASSLYLGGTNTTNYPGLIQHHATEHIFELGNGTDVVRIASGGIRIGTTDPATVFALSIYGTGVGAGIMIENPSGVNMNATLYVNDAGYFSIRTTGGNDRLNISDAGAVRMTYYGAGTATFDASGNITSVSDERLKTDIRRLPYGLKEVLRLAPIAYHHSVESGLDTTYEYGGFGGEAVEAIMPLAVGRDGLGYRTLADRPILGALVNAIGELDKRIAYLEGR